MYTLCTYICTYVHPYVRTYICTYVRMSVCAYVRTFVPPPSALGRNMNSHQTEMHSCLTTLMVHRSSQSSGNESMIDDVKQEIVVLEEDQKKDRLLEILKSLPEKNKTIVFAWCFVSKRVNMCQKHIFLTLREPQNVYQSLAPNQVKNCQSVSKRVKKIENARTHNVFQECQNMSKRVKTCQKAVACQNVSKRVKKVSKKCKKRVKNVSKRVNTCQNVSKNIEIGNFVQCFVSKRVKNFFFLTHFWHFFDTHFCILGREAALAADLITAWNFT